MVVLKWEFAVEVSEFGNTPLVYVITIAFLKIFLGGEGGRTG